MARSPASSATMVAALAFFGCLSAALTVALRPGLAGKSAVKAGSPEAAAHGSPDPGTADSAGRLMQVLDYVAGDYREAVKDGKILDGGEYEEQVEFLARARDMLAGFPSTGLRDSLFHDLRLAAAAVEALAEPALVRSRLQTMMARILSAGLVAAGPKEIPDLARGKRLFGASCASCHGETGRGDGPAGRGLKPPPADFHDRERMEHASPLKIFHAVRYGIDGTAMPAFHGLPETDAWALAYYVRSLAAVESGVAGLD